MGGRHRKVLEHLLLDVGLETAIRERVGHVVVPAIPLVFTHDEVHVAHPQSRVPADFGVRPRAAPVLHQEHRQPVARGLEVVVGS